MSRETEYEEFTEVEIIASTDKAALLRIHGEDQWVPWSLIGADSIERDGDVGTVFIAKWFAEREGL